MIRKIHLCVFQLKGVSLGCNLVPCFKSRLSHFGRKPGLVNMTVSFFASQVSEIRSLERCRRELSVFHRVPHRLRIENTFLTDLTIEDLFLLRDLPTSRIDNLCNVIAGGGFLLYRGEPFPSSRSHDRKLNV